MGLSPLTALQTKEGIFWGGSISSSSWQCWKPPREIQEHSGPEAAAGQDSWNKNGKLRSDTCFSWELLTNISGSVELGLVSF